MGITLDIKPELLERARQMSGIQDETELVNTALEAFAAREAGRALAAMGGTQPDLELAPRRRFLVNQ